MSSSAVQTCARLFMRLANELAVLPGPRSTKAIGSILAATVSLRRSAKSSQCGTGFLVRNSSKCHGRAEFFYGGKFYDYPLRVGNALSNLGPWDSVRVALSFLKWKVFPSKEEENFEQWVCNRFGGRLYWHFFRTYTENAWGIPPTEIRADWAAQRIKDLSLVKAVLDSITRAVDLRP